MSWTTVPLRQLLTQSSRRNRADLPLLSVIREKGVVTRSIDKSENHNVIPDDLSNYKVVSKGQFVINKMKAWQGSCGVSQFDGIVSPAYFVFELKIDNPHFFNYAIRSRKIVDEFGRISKGIRVGQWDLDLQQLKYVPFPLPSHEEQDQIVRFLDWKVSQINKLINAKRRQIALLQEQKRTIIHTAVTKNAEGWREISLGNLGKFRKGFGGSREDDSPNGNACIRYGDIYKSNMIVLSRPITRISSVKTSSYARVFKSEILFALSGETKEEIGQALVNDIDEDTWCSGDTAIFTASNDLLPVFLTYAIQCPYLVAQRASMSKGDIIVHISTDALRRLRVFVPPVDEQIKIVAELNEKCTLIDQFITRANTEISLLQEYRVSLISETVTGKIDVRAVIVPGYERVDDALRSAGELSEPDDIEGSLNA